MAKTYKKGRTPPRDRRITVRGVRREQPDLRKLARALIDIASAQAEADAQAQTTTPALTPPTPPATCPAAGEEGR